jgi:hypothetical protein
VNVSYFFSTVIGQVDTSRQERNTQTHKVIGVMTPVFSSSVDRERQEYSVSLPFL